MIYICAPSKNSPVAKVLTMWGSIKRSKFKALLVAFYKLDAYFEKYLNLTNVNKKGGNIFYKNKYIKYKNKYTNLKYQHNIHE